MTHRDTPPPPSPQREAVADGSFIDSIHANQTAIVDGVEHWIDSVGEALPDLWETPIASGMPPIHRITDAAFDLTRRILAAQRDFTRQIVDSIVDEARKFD